MGWKVFQTLIVLGTVFANIRWHMTDNPLAAGFGGIVLASIATYLANCVLDLAARVRRSLGREQCPDERVAPAAALIGDAAEPVDALRTGQKRLR